MSDLTSLAHEYPNMHLEEQVIEREKLFLLPFKTKMKTKIFGLHGFGELPQEYHAFLEP